METALAGINHDLRLMTFILAAVVLAWFLPSWRLCSSLDRWRLLVWGFSGATCIFQFRVLIAGKAPATGPYASGALVLLIFLMTSALIVHGLENPPGVRRWTLASVAVIVGLALVAVLVE